MFLESFASLNLLSLVLYIFNATDFMSMECYHIFCSFQNCLDNVKILKERYVCQVVFPYMLMVCFCKDLYALSIYCELSCMLLSWGSSFESTLYSAVNYLLDRPKVDLHFN